MAEGRGQGLPRKPRVRFRFRRQEYEFFFQWMAGAQTHGGTEAGEIFAAASRIRERRPSTWVTEWTELARRVEARAVRSLDAGHRVSARESFLRCYAYQRAALLFTSPLREPERYRAQYERARACFRRAAALFDPPIEEIAVPYEGDALPGYLMRPGDGEVPRQTLIMIGGLDTFVEDLYAYIGPAAIKRGYNLVMVDLPGQGMQAGHGRIWRADAEVPMAAVVDWVLGRPDVDSERLAAFGLSGGGYLVPRAVTREKRIKAAVACCAILDLPPLWSKPYLELHRRAERSRAWAAATALLRRWREAYFTMVETYQWRVGAATVPELAEVTRPCVVDAARITRPFLNLIADQEYANPDIRRFADTIEREAAHPTTIVTPAEEGAGTHGVGTNLSLMSQLVFDWLDETFVTAAPAEPERRRTAAAAGA
jgi:hypothetical protein